MTNQSEETIDRLLGYLRPYISADDGEDFDLRVFAQVIVERIGDDLEGITPEQWLADHLIGPRASDEDRAAALTYPRGVVVITDDTLAGGPSMQVGRFATITDAEQWLALSPFVNREKLETGQYTIAAPWGLGSDIEAVACAKGAGFDIFWASGDAYFAKDKATGWSVRYPSLEAAALAALATVDPA
jgi:hypothetical protein